MLGNIFLSPRTTLAGLWATVMAPLGTYVLPAIVAYLGAAPGIGWQVLGALLGFVVPALMRDHPAPKVV